MEKKQAVVIGAGPAGLTAALELLRQSDGYQVTVLEESGAFGGISRTVKHGGNRMDIGGHRFFSKDTRVMDWWSGLFPTQGAPSFDDIILKREKPLVPGGPNPETDDRVMLLRQRVSRIYYGGKFFDYPISMKWETIKNMGFATTMAAGFSYLGSVFHKRPEDNLENFYINRFGKKLYSMFFEGYTEKLWGRHPSEIDASWGAQRVKGLSIRAILKDMFAKVFGKKRSADEVETSLIEQFYYPKYGPGQLWEAAAEEIEKKGGKIIKNARVNAIKTENGRVTAVTYEKDGAVTELGADQFFSTMPVKDLVLGMDAVPEKEKAIATGLPYRDFVTVGLLVDRLELENKTGIPTLGGIVPDCWIYVQEQSVKLGRIQIFNNWSPYMVADPEHTVWIGLEYFCEEGDDFWTMPAQDCIAFATKELVQMGVLKSADQVQDSHREHVKKAYPAYFDTYAEMDSLIAYLSGFENLWCLGRNGQHRYNNMDHSMATAFEAVGNLLKGSSQKQNVWQVNTEQSYHETKAGNS